MDRYTTCLLGWEQLSLLSTSMVNDTLPFYFSLVSFTGLQTCSMVKDTVLVSA